jgi:hypothetical protein
VKKEEERTSTTSSLVSFALITSNMDGVRAARAIANDQQLIPSILQGLQDFLDSEINATISLCNENISSTADIQKQKQTPEENESEWTVNNDEMLLRNPIQVARGTIQPTKASHRAVSSSLVNWLVTSFRIDLIEKIGVEYNWKQLRLLLIKARILMTEIIVNAGADPSSLAPEIIDLYLDDPQHFTNTLFSIFLYTCNFCDCTCVSEDACMRVALEEREVLNGHNPIPNYTTSATHPRVTTLPANTAAYGWNCAIFALLNWPTRISKNPPDCPDSEQIVQDALICCEIFEPLSSVLTYALAHLHPINNTIFRGIGGKVQYPYTRGDMICWPSFSSTSVVAAVAQIFMKNEGTFFVINTRTASMINWYTWFTVEAEALLKMNSVFTHVQHPSVYAGIQL